MAAASIHAEDQLQLGDGRDQIAFVDAARLVVDVEHSTADHDGDIHGHGAAGGEQKLQVIDIGIKLDDLQCNLIGHAGLDDRRVERGDNRLHLAFDGAGAELVGVIDDQADDGLVLGIDAAGVLLGDDDCGVDLAGAHVFAGLHLVVVLDGGEGLDVDGDGVEGLAQLDGLRAVIVIDNSDALAGDLSAEGVAHDEQLQDGHHQRHDHQHGRAEKFAHLALDDGKHSTHGFIPGRGGSVKTGGLTCSSRSWRPV